MSIRTFRTVVLVHAFEQTLQEDAFRSFRDILHCGENLNAVVFEMFAVYRHLVLVAGKSVKFVNCHISLWTLFYITGFNQRYQKLKLTALEMMLFSEHQQFQIRQLCHWDAFLNAV